MHLKYIENLISYNEAEILMHLILNLKQVSYNRIIKNTTQIIEVTTEKRSEANSLSYLSCSMLLLSDIYIKLLVNKL